ncbi:hypothetical protein [Microbacterium sp. 2FI]|uniref:hypothetical protein n=1 Tax=Microbacterium sp. 2FI TaxID=2502193 RepID=UPI0010F610F1|nr:hypothetical protein [Microbacterium sp. 2FI]
MGMLSRFRRKKSPYRALSEEERMSRYVYLLGTLPASVIESAHATAFKDLPADRRREMLEQLKPFMAEDEKSAASDDPVLLARLIRRAEEHRAKRAENASAAPAAATATSVAVDPRDGVDSRDVLASAGVMALVANNFLFSAAITSYFTVGAGSMVIASEPGWVGESFGSTESGGFDGGGGFGG